MTATEFLKTQHREALALIDQLQSRNGGKLSQAQLQMFGKLKSALVFHTAVEEQIFYHELANNEATKDLIQDAYTEHRAVDELLVKLSVAPPNEWPQHLAELRSEISHHVDEEENDLFPAAERLMGQSKLSDIGRQMEQIKKGRSANLGRPFNA